MDPTVPPCLTPVPGCLSVLAENCGVLVTECAEVVTEDAVSLLTPGAGGGVMLRLWLRALCLGDGGGGDLARGAERIGDRRAQFQPQLAGADEELAEEFGEAE